MESSISMLVHLAACMLLWLTSFILDVSVVMHTPDKIQISTSTRLQKFQRLIQVNVWIKAVMSSGNWNRNPSICASSGSSLLQQPRGSESTITSICGSIKLLMRNNCARFETCMIFFFKSSLFCWMCKKSQRMNGSISMTHLGSSSVTKVADG